MSRSCARTFRSRYEPVPAKLRGGLDSPVRIAVPKANLRLCDLDIDGMVSIQELLIDATDLEIGTPPDAFARAELRATLTISESALNRFLAGLRLDEASQLAVAMLTGALEITGRATLGRVAVPFAIRTPIEIVSGARLRIDPTQIRLVGAALPPMFHGYLVKKLNRRIGEMLDTSRLPIPVRLTSVEIQPGRLTLSGVSDVDLRPGQLALARTDSP